MSNLFAICVLAAIYIVYRCPDKVAAKRGETLAGNLKDDWKKIMDMAIHIHQKLKEDPDLGMVLFVLACIAGGMILAAINPLLVFALICFAYPPLGIVLLVLAFGIPML